MVNIVRISDLKDPNDPDGRRYHAVNMAKEHQFAIKELVELDGGVRLFVAAQTRDCDGTPLYSLTYETHDGPIAHLIRGVSERYMRRV